MANNILLPLLNRNPPTNPPPNLQPIHRPPLLLLHPPRFKRLIYAPAPPYWRWHLERAYYLKIGFDNKIYQYYLDELLEVGRICRDMRELHGKLGLDLIWVAEQWREAHWKFMRGRVIMLLSRLLFGPGIRLRGVA